MVRWPFVQTHTETTVYAEGFCNSEDSKPTKIDGMDIITGSSLYEVDTSKPFLYDEKTSSWVEQGGSGDA